MVDKIHNDVLDPNGNPQLDQDMGAIGPGGANIWARVVAAAIKAGTALIGKVGIDQVTPNANEVVVKSGAVTATPATLGQAHMAQSSPVVVASDQSAIPINLAGSLKTLLAPATITTDATTVSTPVTGLDVYSRAGIQLIVSGKTMDALTTLNIYIQRSVDGGTNWDDIAAFTQITSVAIANGTYMLGLMLTGSAQVDRIKSDGALTANTVASIASWGDRLRVKTVAANFAGTDTVTIAVVAFMVP
jgi:hypothetical protein